MGKGADFEWLKRISKDRRSREWISKIEKWHKLAYEGKFSRSKRLFPVNLGGYKIWFRECSAYSSVDIYTEIFKENYHFLVPGFSGEDADLVIDIGANEGYYTLKLKENNPKCKVVAVEPNPLAFEILEKNIESNGLENVILVNKAVCGRSGEITFEIVEQVSAISAKDLGIIERPWLKEEMIKRIKVDCVTLADLFRDCGIEEVDILKLDVEGMEFEILKNSRDLLHKIHKMVVEWHSKEIRDNLKKFLSKQGFKLLYEEKRMCGDLYFGK